MSFHVWLFSFENIRFKFHRTYLSSCPKQKYLPFLVPAWPPLDMMGDEKLIEEDIRKFELIDRSDLSSLVEEIEVKRISDKTVSFIFKKKL